LILMLYRHRRTLDVSVWQDLREENQEPEEEEPLPTPPKVVPPPHLSPAGIEPKHKQETSHV